MSKYKLKIDERKLEHLDDLLRVARKVKEEIEPLQSYLNSVEGQIIETMRELNIDFHKGVRLFDGKRQFVNLGKLAEKKSLLPYVIAEVLFDSTLADMYGDNIDYKVAKNLLQEGIEKAKLYEVDDVRINY